MVIPSWISVAKWVGIVAVILAMIALPTVYVNKKIDSAYQSGYDHGVDAGVAAQAEETMRLVQEAEARMSEESQKAQKLEAQNAKIRAESRKLENKLTEALAKEPAPVSCVVNSAATSLLRGFADGDFDLAGEAVPGQLDPKVPNRTEFPREGGFNNSGFSSRVQGGSGNLP